VNHLCDSDVMKEKCTMGTQAPGQSQQNDSEVRRRRGGGAVVFLL
jgi:hypothetical protein